MKILQQGLLPIIVAAAAMLSPTYVSAGKEIVVDSLPPSPHIENAPRHRDGYVWAPGYWEWTGKFFHWVSGTWVIERHSSHWVADHWEQVGSQWRYVPGQWEPLQDSYSARTR